MQSIIISAIQIIVIIYVIASVCRILADYNYKKLNDLTLKLIDIKTKIAELQDLGKNTENLNKLLEYYISEKSQYDESVDTYEQNRKSMAALFYSMLLLGLVIAVIVILIVSI